MKDEFPRFIVCEKSLYIIIAALSCQRQQKKHPFYGLLAKMNESQSTMNGNGHRKRHEIGVCFKHAYIPRNAACRCPLHITMALWQTYMY